MDPSRAPPPLAWLPSFCTSTGAALGQPMVFEVQPTVNPLVYKAVITWPEKVAGSLSNQVWNLMQMWMTTNDCVPNGGVALTGNSLTVHVVVKRRFGNPKNESP